MDPDQQLSPARINRAWNTVTWAGVLGSTYILLCITGAPRIKFLTELKATAADFGIIAGLGALAIAFQIVGSIITNHLVRRKRIWMFIAIVHRLLFAGTLFAPFIFIDPHFRIWWIIFVFFAHDAMAHIASPIWLSWMADLVPTEQMNKLWASRQRFITATNIIAMIIMAFGFYWFERHGQVIRGFVILGAIGVAMGVLDIVMFYKVPDVPNERMAAHDVFATIVQPLRDPKFRPYLWFMAYWHFSIAFGAPFFGLFMIEDLKMSALTTQLLGVPAAVGVVAVSRYWGLICDTYGFRAVFQVLTLGKAFTPLFFILAPQDQRFGIPFLAVMQFLDGGMNAGVALAMQGTLLKNTPRLNRTMYIAAANFFSIGIVSGITPPVAGMMIDSLNKYVHHDFGPYHFTGYHCVFLLGMLLRFGALPLAARLHDDIQVSARTLFGQMRSWKPYWVTRLVYQLHESRDETLRLRTIDKLGELKNPLAIGELIHCLKDGSAAVREAAANALGHIGMDEAANALARALRDPTFHVQSTAARALGKIGGEESLRALLLNLKASSPESLGEIIDALGSIGDSAAIVPLISLFYDLQDDGLRHRIALALGRMSEIESVEDVLASLPGALSK